MALRMGIGDVLTICKGAVDIAKTIHEEPEELRSVVAEMKTMRAHLKSLESQMGDEKSFASARPDIAPVIKRSLEPLHRDLTSMNEMLHDYHRKPSVHVVDKVRYLVLYKAKLDGFRDKLPAHRKSICVIQELIEGQSPRERRESTVKLCELIEEHEKQAELQEEYDRAQREVVKMFEERLPSCKITPHPSSSEMLEQLEEDLVAKGVPREKAHEQLFPITKALLLQPLVLSPSRKPREPKPTFKLDVFETISHTTTAGDLHRCISKEISENEKESILTNGSNGRASSSDNLSTSPGTRNECWALQKVSPVKEVKAALVVPEIKRGVVQRSTTASPVAFLTRRRPLLTEQSRTKSSEFFASWIDPKRVSP